MLEGAIAFQALKYDWYYRNQQNDNTHGTHVVNNILDVGYQTSYAIFGQLNIPVVGPEMGIPLVENFLIELGYRYDHYDNLDDPVFVRKIAANWTLGYGFTLRGAWGESFRVPSFAEAGARSRVAGLNPLGLVCCCGVLKPWFKFVATPCHNSKFSSCFGRLKQQEF
jgi:outer membrane receptor protein involved in Fe transport